MTSTDSSAGPAVASPAGRYLEQARARLEQIRADMPALSAFGKDMADPLVDGGDIYVPPVARFWPSEIGGRAGGIMALKRRGGKMTDRDVAYIATHDPRKWDPRDDENLQKLIAGPGKLFVNGRPEDLAALGDLGRFAGFTGGADPAEGSYNFNGRQPLVGFRQLEQYVRGWAGLGEMIGHCIERGRMPIMYMSVWLEGALVRNASMTRHDNLAEPWSPPLFHDNLYIQPPGAGALGSAFVDIVEDLRQTLVGQLDRLAQAARWLVEARRAGKRTWVVAVGHSYPEILGGKTDEEHGQPLTWGPSFSDLIKAIPDDFADGDTVLHLGYAPVNADNVRHWTDRGVRLIHSSPYGPARDLEPSDNFLWLDLPWRPGDAAVDLPGYSVRILPSSSSAHTLAYSAILSEMAEIEGW